MEVDVGGRLLHLLVRALPAPFLAHVDKICMIRIHSLAATESVAQWRKLWHRLYTEKKLRVHVARVLAGFPWSKHWCALSFVAVLRART